MAGAARAAEAGDRAHDRCFARDGEPGRERPARERTHPGRETQDHSARPAIDEGAWLIALTGSFFQDCFMWYMIRWFKPTVAWHGGAAIDAQRQAEESSMAAGKSLLNRAAFVVFGIISSAAFAAGAGTVTHLSGSLSAQRPDGSARILSQRSEVNPGDVLTTERDSYAQINFTDGSSITLRPNSSVKVDAYSYAKDKPQEDNMFLRLVKGGLRTVTGLVGRRGNADAYKIGTQTATVGIRGSSGDTLECSQGCPGVTPTSDKL